MTPDNEKIKTIIDTVKLNLKIGDQLLPVFFIVNDTKKEVEIVASHMENDRAKDFTAKAVEEKARKIGAEYIVFVAESYVLEEVKDPSEYSRIIDQYGSIGNHPDAKEKVVITIETKTRQHTGMADILPGRELGEVKWLDPDNAGGRFANLLGEKPVRH